MQAPDQTLMFAQLRYLDRNDRRPERLHEDFCGTGLLSGSWVEWNRRNEAWGIDLHGPTLRWGRRARTRQLGEAMDRLHLVEADVCKAQMPPADIVLATNFSYFIFHARSQLKAYFEHVRRRLSPGGVYILDHFGGTAAMDTCREVRRVKKARTWQGQRMPAFTYVWEQRRFNAVTHGLDCSIHFEFGDGSAKRHAFRYPWRYWMLPEIVELLWESEFEDVEVYTHGWTQGGVSNDEYQRVTDFVNEPSWLAYVVGRTAP